MGGFFRDPPPVVIPPDVTRYHFEPGDVLVLTCEKDLTAAQAAHIRATLKESLRRAVRNDIEVVILAGGLKLEVANAARLPAEALEQLEGYPRRPPQPEGNP